MRVSVDEMMNNFEFLLERVAAGKEITLVEGDREVARLLPPRAREERIAQTKAFRDAFAVRGESLSATVVRERQGERY
jgi:antitoxin (DNA-binding transcriptional repressor) of toxin-antitoxin stability system